MKGSTNYLSLLVNHTRIEGFVVMDYLRGMASGKVKEYVVDGLETFPETLLKLFSGENFGKLVLKA